MRAGRLFRAKAPSYSGYDLGYKSVVLETAGSALAKGCSDVPCSECKGICNSLTGRPNIKFRNRTQSEPKFLLPPKTGKRPNQNFLGLVSSHRCPRRCISVDL